MSTVIVIRQLKLHSPAGCEPAVFTWPCDEQQQQQRQNHFLVGYEIVQTLRLVFEDYPELYQESLSLDQCDIHSYADIKELTEKFNKIMDTYVKLNRGTEAFSARIQQRATSKLFRHLLNQIYNRAVTNPDKLREYEPFSPSVYGETSPDLIDSILRTINLGEDDVFLDLGSGVGNVVLQVAALANCKLVYGIEHETIPAGYAKAMEKEFRFWMRWYGKSFSDFQLEQGDFLHHPDIDERIREADVIFVNNYVFGSTVNHELKMKFINMKDGARIISSREFCPETFRLNNRTKNDLGAILHVTKPQEFFGKVSWSDKSVQYYLHITDHRKLADYYEKAQQRRSQKSKASNDDEQSSSSFDSASVKSNENSQCSSLKRKDSLSRQNENETVKMARVHSPLNNRVTNRLLPSTEEDRQSTNLINSYLEQFRQRLFSYFTSMKSNIYRQHLQEQLKNEKELNENLKYKVSCLENNIKVLLEDAIHLLQLRTQELGIEQLERPEQLLTYANEISSKHKDLRLKVASLEKEIDQYSQENDQINSILTNLNRQRVEIPISPNHQKTKENFKDSTPRIPIRTMERQADFLIEKRSKKLSNHPIEFTFKSQSHSSRSFSNTNPLLSTKTLEPVQIHSIISSDKSLIKEKVSSLSIQSMSKASSNHEKPICDDSSEQSPKKKRDFYGRSSDIPTQPQRRAQKKSSSLLQEHRPSSTPSCVVATVTSASDDRLNSLPRLKTPP